MTHINYLRHDCVDSTNTLLASLNDAPHGTVLSAVAQTAGRGQRGNSWEADPGRNITLSILLRPSTLPARRQFAISEAVALGVVLTLDRFLSPTAQATVKWPNDIYVGNRKICGILIENTLSGQNICRSIAGIGLNVNQQRFLSDAPNPVSMLQLEGHGFNIAEVEQEMCQSIASLFDTYVATGRFDTLHDLYTARLWRGVGSYPFRDCASGQLFTASIDSIGPMGHLSLKLADGTLRTYAFKEVAFIL